jgi:hypothetical protein
VFREFKVYSDKIKCQRPKIIEDITSVFDSTLPAN